MELMIFRDREFVCASGRALVRASVRALAPAFWRIDAKV